MQFLALVHLGDGQCVPVQRLYRRIVAVTSVVELTVEWFPT